MFLAQLLTCCVLMSLGSLSEPCLLHVCGLMPTFCDAVFTHGEWGQTTPFSFPEVPYSIPTVGCSAGHSLVWRGGRGEDVSSQVQTLLWNSCDQFQNSS